MKSIPLIIPEEGRIKVTKKQRKEIVESLIELMQVPVEFEGFIHDICELTGVKHKNVFSRGFMIGMKYMGFSIYEKEEFEAKQKAKKPSKRQRNEPQ